MSIEREVRETIRQAIVDGSMLGSTYEDSAMTEEAYQKRFELILNLHTDAILKLTNPPLSEKEVEKFLDETTGLNKHCCKEIAINLCHNFSKPVIKYPEKKDKLDFKNDDSITLGFKDGWNQAISDMRKLNGEGGV